MPVGGQHRSRSQPVRLQHLGEPVDHPDAGVDDEELAIAGIRVRVTHCPGHTEGSVMFSLPEAPDGAEDVGSTVLTGDVLFAGSIGRTDLPGGDHAAMRRSLLERVLPLPDDALILPGHGPATMMAVERTSNPFLLELVGPA